MIGFKENSEELNHFQKSISSLKLTFLAAQEQLSDILTNAPKDIYEDEPFDNYLKGLYEMKIDLAKIINKL